MERWERTLGLEQGGMGDGGLDVETLTAADVSVYATVCVIGRNSSESMTLVR